MQDENKLEKVLERFYNRYNKYNTKVLQTLGEAVKQFDGIKPSDAHKIAQQLKYGTDIDELVNELAELTNQSNADIYELMDEVAKENVEFAEVYAKAKGKQLIGYENNEQLQRLVDAIASKTADTMINITNTRAVGFAWKEADKTIFKPLKRVYNDLIDEAVYNVATGTTNYQSAMTNVINNLADSGVRVHDSKMTYESGYSRRVDTAVRQNVLDGVRQVNIQVQEEVGDLIGANGVEISAHSPCAEDHLHVQGKQFSKKEFARVNGDLERPIGEYNCKHFIFSVILGVSRPSYSKKTLNKMADDSLKQVTYEGKTYTKYEATQVQRQFETKIREQKDRQIIAKASGNKEAISKAQQNITTYTDKYKEFSKSVGLDTYANRLKVSGYKRVSTK